jgi:hypothetical protein
LAPQSGRQTIAFGQTRRQTIVVSTVPVADVSVMVGIAVVTVTMSVPVAVFMIVIGAIIVVTIVFVVAVAIRLGLQRWCLKAPASTTHMCQREISL